MDLASWILTMMTALEPAAPWRTTYEDTANVLAQVATEEPLFSGPDGATRTAALFVSVAWFEGRLDPRAKGDCRKKDDKGRCVADPQSLCLFQIGVSNLKGLGVTADELLESTETCTRTARRMMAASFGVCRGRPADELLGHYAAGGTTCDNGLRESRHRVAKAKWLLKAFPWEQ